MRKGKVIKYTEEMVYFVTSLLAQEASPEVLLKSIRDHWSIENGSIIAGIGPRMKIAAWCARLTRRASSHCFGLWRSSSMKRSAAKEEVRNPGRILSAKSAVTPGR